MRQMVSAAKSKNLPGPDADELRNSLPGGREENRYNAGPNTPGRQEQIREGSACGAGGAASLSPQSDSNQLVKTKALGSELGN
jgi:hypothetical protein